MMQNSWIAIIRERSTHPYHPSQTPSGSQLLSTSYLRDQQKHRYAVKVLDRVAEGSKNSQSVMQQAKYENEDGIDEQGCHKWTRSALFKRSELGFMSDAFALKPVPEGQEL